MGRHGFSDKRNQSQQPEFSCHLERSQKSSGRTLGKPVTEEGWDLAEGFCSLRVPPSGAENRRSAVESGDCSPTGSSAEAGMSVQTALQGPDQGNQDLVGQPWESNYFEPQDPCLKWKSKTRWSLRSLLTLNMWQSSLYDSFQHLSIEDPAISEFVG